MNCCLMLSLNRSSEPHPIYMSLHDIGIYPGELTLHHRQLAKKRPRKELTQILQLQWGLGFLKFHDNWIVQPKCPLFVTHQTSLPLNWQHLFPYIIFFQGEECHNVKRNRNAEYAVQKWVRFTRRRSISREHYTYWSIRTSLVSLSFYSDPQERASHGIWTNWLNESPYTSDRVMKPSVLVTSPNPSFYVLHHPAGTCFGVGKKFFFASMGLAKTSCSGLLLDSFRNIKRSDGVFTPGSSPADL